MQRIPRELARKYGFDARDAPLMHVQPGESIETETFDASTGCFKSEADKAIPGQRPGFDRMPPLASPVAGPVLVEGAERGGALVLKIYEIVVDDYEFRRRRRDPQTLPGVMRFPRKARFFESRRRAVRRNPLGVIDRNSN